MKKYFAAFLFIIFIGGGLYTYFVLGNQLRSLRGEVMTMKYVVSMYSEYTVAGKSCQGEDTNKDGYITCNARLRQASTGAERTITLQCPTLIKSYTATSCKEQGIMINTQ
jgi:hypothetical protein